MVVVAANVTNNTTHLLEQIIDTNDFAEFARKNNLNLTDKTILIRLALINLYKNLPSSDDISSYKAALLKPHEFDDFWTKALGEHDVS